jgi:hypothetical protein
MSHRGLETNNRDPGAGFGSLRSCVQRFLRLGNLYASTLTEVSITRVLQDTQHCLPVVNYFTYVDEQLYHYYGEDGNISAWFEQREHNSTDCCSRASARQFPGL